MIKAALAVLACGFSLAVNASSPYLGQDTREIKSLSAGEISDYLDGKGMGYAKAAELNHYPGPRHVLDLSQQLGLTPVQQEQTRLLFERMRQAASEAGARLVAAERELDRRFASGRIDPASLGTLLETIARIEGQIRYIHLAAHLEQRALLSRDQVQHYDRLRGYGMGHTGSEHHSH
ncbi:MAG: hypothetical protein OQL28_16740 [Sedimenticola sp.]|nr:hypothetical protein [Sedimenticola sp.]